MSNNLLDFVDLFAGIGGFHIALEKLGHNCVFASEIDENLRNCYEKNFEMDENSVLGDIRGINLDLIPRHDILCAGFPCQPFSKAGSQLGLNDLVQGTLFQNIIEVLEKRRPKYLMLENVGNFSRHDNGNTWKIVRESLEQLGYDIVASEPKASNGPGLISPHHYGFPHRRERFFILGSTDKIPTALHALLTSSRMKVIEGEETLSSLIQENLSDVEIEETALSKMQENNINHWNKLIKNIPIDMHIPSPLWGDEIDASYPYNNGKVPNDLSEEEGISLGIDMGKLPAYAKRNGPFPDWKQKYIKRSREWFKDIKPYIPEGWVEKLKEFSPSLRKLEWNCNRYNGSKTGESERDIWNNIIQFRPSGVRVTPYNRIPALVASTSTQIPILGPHRRYITRKEGLLLQGFSEDHSLPESKRESFRALGNAVHAGVVQRLAAKLLHNKQETSSRGY